MKNSPLKRKRLANNLRKLRGEKGWTQEDLSVESRISYAAIRSYERAKSYPQPRSLADLCRALGVPEEDLTGSNSALEDQDLLNEPVSYSQYDRVVRQNAKLEQENEKLRGQVGQLEKKLARYIRKSLKK